MCSFTCSEFVCACSSVLRWSCSTRAALCLSDTHWRDRCFCIGRCAAARHYSFYTLTIPSLVIGHLVSAAGVATQVLGRLSRDTTLEPQTLYGFYQPSSDNRLIEPGENADAMVAGLCRQCIQCDLADAVARRACLCLTAASRGPRSRHAGTGVTGRSRRFTPTGRGAGPFTVSLHEASTVLHLRLPPACFLRRVGRPQPECRGVDCAVPAVGPA